MPFRPDYFVTLSALDTLRRGIVQLPLKYSKASVMLSNFCCCKEEREVPSILCQCEYYYPFKMQIKVMKVTENKANPRDFTC